VTDYSLSQVFLEYIPSRIGIAGSAASDVLQKFLEKYFAWYFSDITEESPLSYDMTTIEALKILVRSYLSDLQRHNLNTSGKKKSQNSECEDSRRKINTNRSGSSWDSCSDARVNTIFILLQLSNFSVWHTVIKRE
jgi:hypothetical protein